MNKGRLGTWSHVLPTRIYYCTNNKQPTHCVHHFQPGLGQPTPIYPFQQPTLCAPFPTYKNRSMMHELITLNRNNHNLRLRTDKYWRGRTLIDRVLRDCGCNHEVEFLLVFFFH